MADERTPSFFRSQAYLEGRGILQELQRQQRIRTYFSSQAYLQLRVMMQRMRQQEIVVDQVNQEEEEEEDEEVPVLNVPEVNLNDLDARLTRVEAKLDSLLALARTLARNV